MTGYTVVNLQELEDQAPKFDLGPDLEARFASVPLGLEKSGLSYQRLAPSYRIPFGHTHGKQEELYVLVKGAAQLKLDGEIVQLKAWDAVRIPAGIMHDIEAGPDGAELLAFGAPSTGQPQTDIEMTPGWWAD